MLPYLRLLLRARKTDREAATANSMWRSLDLPENTMPTVETYIEAAEAGDWNRALAIAKLVLYCAEHESLWEWSGGPIAQDRLTAWRKRRASAMRRGT